MSTDELIARDALYRWLGEHRDVPRNLDFSEWIAGWLDAQRVGASMVPATKSTLYLAGWRYYCEDAMIEP